MESLKENKEEKKNIIQGFIGKITYRSWQFYKAVFPKLNLESWNVAEKKANPKLVPLLSQLGNAEKSHILRVLELIKEDKALSEKEKDELSDFALVHDIGKAITKPSLLFKVMKVLLRLSSDAHCIAGCRAVWHLTKNKNLALRILKHHIKPNSDKFLVKFQEYDDRA